MLPNYHISQLEPHLPPSPLSSRAQTTARSNISTHMDSMQASTSKFILPPKQSFVPPCISRSSAFYQVLTAQYRRHALPVVGPGTPVDPRHTDAYKNSVNLTRRLSAPETHVGHQSAGTNATILANREQRIYRPHGRWAWADGLSIDNTEELVRLECKRSVKFRSTRLYIATCSWNTVFYRH
jgi:hypothetical protein